MFIVLEGIDGCGKTTLLNNLSNFFLSKKTDYLLLTREPTKSKPGLLIRKWLNSKENHTNEEFLELFVEDRREHLKKISQFIKDENSVVLCDRYHYSTFAYQKAQGISQEKLLSFFEEFPIPDIVFILDLPVETALSRISRRSPTDLFEKKEFLEKVRKNYLDLKQLLSSHNIFYLDASKKPQEVQKQAEEIISNFLKSRI